ncbi:MAG: thymidylate synthase [Armatimonadetes bacterium]|nr:thymidylate synthase [Armatimonadota bacterium]
MIRYRPFQERIPDTQYRDLLRLILDEGEEVPTRQGVSALKIVGHLMRFSLENGFPLITERDLLSAPHNRPSLFHQALGEICAFLNGAQTREELERFGCYWWTPWVTPEQCAQYGLPPGDLGPASYGAAFRRFPTEEGPFDQIAHLIEQIRHSPHLRYHEVNPWIPHYLSRARGRRQRAVVPPCHGWFHVHINTRAGELTLSHRQRSADAPVGLAFNIIHYAALAMMIAQVTGYTPRALVCYVDDVHIYMNQVEHVREMLATEPQRFPTVDVDPTVADIFAFRPEHFSVSHYHPRLPRRRIPTPV